MNFKTNNPKPISLDDIVKAATRLSCEPAAILSVSEIEAPKGGFLKDGRPTILFEAHVFSKYTNHIYDISHPNISSPSWDRSLYGSSGAHQYDRFNEAFKLDPVAALLACSWGKYQIMGFNYKACGYSKHSLFVDAMVESEARQLEAFVNFILSNKRLVASLKNKDWDTFTRYYNGPGQISLYSSRIRSVYPDCTKKVQQYLKELGLYLGIVDGLWGKNSKTALEKYIASTRV